jgi:hypothetical protein
MEKFKLWLKENFIYLITVIFFMSFIFWLIYLIINENGIKDYIEPLIILIGSFIAWIQFIVQKHNKKKEVALTYFPKVTELDKIENEIDEVINFWSSAEPLDSYVVKLLLDEKLNDDEYKLIWNKLSFGVKNKISTEENNTELDFKEEYKPYIHDIYAKVRRKLNLYLNQIESYCLAINNGVIDSKSAYNFYSHKFKWHFIKARLYIDKLRIIKNENNLYSELEKVVEEWKKIK